MNRRDRQQAADLLHRLLEAVDHEEISADGPAGVALVRRLEGAEIAVIAIDSDPLHRSTKKADGRG
jgi:hypothetical protein